MIRFHSLRRASLLVLPCAAAFACSSPPSPSSGDTAGASANPTGATHAASGQVQILARTTASLSTADIRTVAVTVSGSNIPTPMTSDLALSSSAWQGTIGDIPVGIATFTGDAFGVSQTLLYSGSAANVPVTAGATAVVGLLMQQTSAPAGFSDSAPVIETFTASVNPVAPGATVTVSGTAEEPGGGSLTYAWTADGGSFASPGSATTTWSAPATTGSYDLTFQATDAAGLTAGVTFTLAVENGNAEVIATFNTWPTVGGMTAAPVRINVGDTTTLGITDADADGDTLSYAWTSDCTGSFSAPTASSTTFTLSSLPQSGTCTFVSAVTDGRGGSNSGTVVLQAGAGPSLYVLCPSEFGGSVDQSQYGADGEYYGIEANQNVTQTLTAGTAGALTGIELQITACRGTSSTTEVDMEIFDGSNDDLGTATLKGSALATACAGDTVSPGSVGPGLFDLTSLCVQVTPGEQITYVLSVSGGSPATCDQSSWTCSNGGSDCMGDFDCQQYVGFDVAPLYGGGQFLGDAIVYKSYVESAPAP